MASKKRIQYTVDRLHIAIDNVRNGVSIRAASRMFNIPASTIRDKIKNRYPNPAGAPPVLSLEDENRIVKWIIDMAKAGFPVNSQRLRANVAQYVRQMNIKNPFKNGVPGAKWVALFLKRHPTISRRVPSTLSKNRTIVTEQQVRRWFQEISTFFKDNNLEEVMKNPNQIFNMDETAVRTVPTKEVVLAEANGSQVHTRVSNSDKESYTALFSGNAGGMLAPTMMLFPYKQRIPGDIFRRLPKGWAAGKTESGWMTRDTFFLYIRNVFYPWLLRENFQFPVVIFVDGHSSHVSIQTTTFCKEKNMILICLPPNTTQITQPLDVSFFRPLKLYWNQLLVDWRIDHAGDLLPRSEIAPMLHKAVMKMENLFSILSNGFRRCGLYPWDVEAINYSVLVRQESNDSHEYCTHQQNHNTERTSASSNNLLTDVQHYMTNRQVEVFNRSDSSGEWLGNSDETALFEVWKRIKYGDDQPHQNHDPESASVDDEPPFQGFATEEMRASDSSMLITDRDQAQPLDLSFRPVPDVLRETFRIPNVQKNDKVKRKLKPQPPSVATSDAYDEYVENIENTKRAEQLEKEKKKHERQAKRKMKTDQLQSRKKKK